jgi:hypothetical protein
MRLLDEKLSTAAPEPPMRNIVGQMAMVRVRKPRHQSLHELAPDGSETRLAPAIMPLLRQQMRAHCDGAHRHRAHSTSLIVILESFFASIQGLPLSCHGPQV